LRVTGTGYPTGLWTWEAVGGRRCAVDNPFFTWRWFDPRRAREPVPFAIEMPKPDGRIRIFVLGASAAQGDPDPAYSMSRFMEILFARGWPEADIEVVNLAMTAINSHVVLPIATSSFELDPDLVVVYLGNNEVIGPHGVVDGPRTVADRLRHLLVATRIGQLPQRARIERDVRRGDADEWGGMEDYVEHRVAHDDPRLERIYSDFERNLTDLVTAADRSGVPVVLATVAVNLADSPPFGSRHRPDDWFLHYHLGRMLSGSDPDPAISHLRRALKLRPSFDIGRRALGHLLLGTDQPEQAASELGAVAARHPYSPGTVLDLGIALLRARRIDQAETALRRAMVLDPNEPEAPYHLALALLAAEAEPDGPSREEAEALLERALAADPDHQDASRVLSRIREGD
jgi:hypothetical protein